MKKFLLPLLSILLLTACQKDISTTKVQEEIAGVTANKQTKFFVCHYDAVTGTSKTIEVTQNALAAHLAHGDVQGECSAVQTTTNCDQVWMVRNLDVDHYRNGDPIPQVTDPDEWIVLTTGAWCYYNNDPANGPIYGKLYNWYAVNDPRGLAPTGWHVPTDAEWTTLYSCLGGDAVAGGKMKSMGTIEAGDGLWYAPNGDATNSSGFTGVPGGFRANVFTGPFYNVGIDALWWSSTEVGNGNAWYHGLTYLSGNILRTEYFEHSGFSVRCLRDN